MQQTITPIDNTIYIEREYNSDKIETTINNSTKAQISWYNLSIKERVVLLKKFVEDFLSRENIISEELSKQIGRPISQAASELKGFKERADYMLSIAEEKLSDIDVTKDNNFKSFIRRRALGVVFVIAPWNYPYLTAVNSIIPALAAGNSIILKHSAQTPLCAEQLYQSAQKTLPKDVFNYLHLNHQDGLKVVSDKRINFVSFTGSVKAGYDVQRATHTKFIDMALELGGKDPAYARHDCDLEKTVNGVTRAGFLNQGQVCLCGSRILVQEKIYDEFIEKFVLKVEQMKIGDPSDEETDLGALISPEHLSKIEKYIQIAKDEGGEILTGGYPQLSEKYNSGNWICPTVIANLDVNSRCSTEEIFGPVVTIHKFKDEGEAIEIANNTRYGLAGSIWTEDLEKGNRVAESIDTGMIWINTWLHRDLRVPFGGVKDSGVGREGGRWSLNFFSEVMNICTKFN